VLVVLEKPMLIYGKKQKSKKLRKERLKRKAKNKK